MNESVTRQHAPAVRFTHVSRHFGDVRAVDDVSLDIVDGEFFTMLGPSGSGKTTCLRLIAGFEQPTGGSIQLHGARRPASRRMSAMSTPSFRITRCSRI